MLEMKTSERGYSLIKQFEGCRLAAYKDSVGIPTIGYGHTHGVTMDLACSQEEADSWLKVDAVWAEACVNSHAVKLLTQNQFDALVSFVFNLGCEAFTGSSLLRAINRGDFMTAANEFLRWIHAGQQILPGLVRRRTAEKDLFQQQQAPPPQVTA